MRRVYPLLLLVACQGLVGCLNLRAVSLFSTSASSSLRQGATLPATFTGIYQQRTIDDSLDRHPFKQIPLIGIRFSQRVRQDSLRSYQLADSLTRAGSDLLMNYFTALASLSRTDSTFVPVRLQSPTFEHYLQNSALKLTPAQVISFNRVVNLIGSVATGAYRRRKTGELLARSHGDVRQMLGVLVFAYERLADVVDISRDQQYGQYKNIVTKDLTLTYAQKRALAQQWLQTARTIEQTRQVVLTHVKSLKTVQVGFDQLYTSRDALNSKTLLAAMGTVASTLQRLRADMEELKPVYGRLYP